MTTPIFDCTRCNGSGCYECVPEHTPANEWREEFYKIISETVLRKDENWATKNEKDIEIFIQNLLTTYSAHCNKQLEICQRKETTKKEQ
jgi:hypothetical protein